MKRAISWVWIPLVSVGCAPAPAPAPVAETTTNRPITVYVDSYPLLYFAERVGGDLVEVHLPVAPDRDPAYFKPNKEQISAIQSADLVLINGADYSKWPAIVSLAPSKLVDTSRGFKSRFIKIEDAVVHSHGPDGEHSHEGLASFTWLDPDQAILQAEAIAKALKRTFPEESSPIDERFASLSKDLTSIKDRLQELVARRDQPLLASHPVYDYLARHCGWDLKSLHWEPNEMPSEEGWAELAKLIEKHPAQWIIWEGDPMDSIVQRLVGMGIDSVVFDCCIRKPAEGDYLTVMNQNLDELARMYQGATDGTGATAP